MSAAKSQHQVEQFRRAPKVSGYLFPEKDKYRTNVWGAFRGAWGCDLSRKTVLMLPSKEGVELDVAIENGVMAENIIAVDDNPALIATAPWRKTYPAVTAMGSSLGRAAERIKETGRQIDIANLDLCNNFSGAMLQEIRRFAEAEVLADTAVVGVTLLKGREQPETVAALSILAEKCGMEWRTDPARPFFAQLFLAEALAKRSWCVIDSGEYRSGTQNMVWMVVATATKEAMMREARERGYLQELTHPAYGSNGFGGAREKGRDRQTGDEVNEYFRYRGSRYRDGPLPRWGYVESKYGGRARWKWSHEDNPHIHPAEKAAFRRMKEQFKSADEAVAYFDGAYFGGQVGPNVYGDPWVEGVWGEALERWASDKEKEYRTAMAMANPTLPWTESWRNRPTFPVTFTRVHRDHYVPSGDRLSESQMRPQPATENEPLGDWLINRGGTSPTQTPGAT